MQDLIIPFSNFNRKGLRGEGRLTCAGAVSFTIRTDGYHDVTLSAGPIFTNSNDPFEALILTPTPTAIPATPTMVGGLSATPTRTPTGVPTVGSVESPAPTKVVEEVATGALGAEVPSVATPRPPSVSQVVVAPLNTPKPRREEEEETVYGSIVGE